MLFRLPLNDIAHTVIFCWIFINVVLVSQNWLEERREKKRKRLEEKRKQQAQNARGNMIKVIYTLIDHIVLVISVELKC